MSVQCCPTKSICVDPANPIQNFSSEAPDLTLFIGDPPWSGGPGGPGAPPTGGTWVSSGCGDVQCISTISQADADQCAANLQTATCMGGWTNPPGQPVIPAFNNQESCTSLCPDGLPFSYTVPAGTISALNQATANEIAQSFACENARLRRICLSSLSAPEACVNAAYTATIRASGGFITANNTWIVASGRLPLGVNLVGSLIVGPDANVVTGPVLTISGTPTETGTFPFTIRVTALNGDFMVKNYSLCVIGIDPQTLPSGSTGSSYSQTLTATGCAQTPLSWQVTSGALPPGLTLDESSGIISGTPTTAGTFTFTITAQTAAT